MILLNLAADTDATSSLVSYIISDDNVLVDEQVHHDLMDGKCRKSDSMTRSRHAWGGCDSQRMN